MTQRNSLIVLDRFPDEATDAWRRLLRDVVGGGSASSPLVAALDQPVDALLEGVDVEAALDAADEPRADASSSPGTSTVPPAAPEAAEQPDQRRELIPADA